MNNMLLPEIEVETKYKDPVLDLVQFILVVVALNMIIIFSYNCFY